jgi:hydrogenase-4 component E
MTAWTDILLSLIVLIDLALLGSSRLAACIRLVAVQGILLGSLPLAVSADELSAHVLILAVGSTALKGVLFPWLLFRTGRGAAVRREVEPFVSFTLSILFGALALGVSFWLGSRLTESTSAMSPLRVSVSLYTILVGLFLIVSRRKAITQVLGYLVLENGIYVFGVGLVQDAPLLVELGVLLDVFVAVFVMGITVFHINREFDSIDTDRLSTLKDWTP